MANKIKTKYFTEFFGMDRHVSELNLLPGYSWNIRNLQYVEQNKLGPRPGSQPICASAGGHGIVVYNHFDLDTKTYETKILVVSDTVEELVEDTITVAYAGVSTCTVSLYSVPATSVVKFKIVEGSTTKLDQSLGKGYDEASPYTLSQLKTAIDAISGGSFTATISGTTTTPAAFLRRSAGKTLTSISSVAFACFHPSVVNTSVNEMLSWFEDNKNSDEFVNCVPIQARNAIFFPNPTEGYGMLKYDSQRLYRAGVPTLTAPIGAIVAGAAGTAEISTITTRAAAAVAEVSTVTTIADTGVAEVFTCQCVQSGRSNYDGKYFLTADANGSVAIWFSGSQPEPSHGADRAIEVPNNSGGSNTSVATDLKDAIDADAQFSATRSGATVTITNVSFGTRTDASLGSFPSQTITLTTTVQGSGGLNNKHFNLYEPVTNNKVTVWLNASSTGVQPNTGASRYIAVPFTTGATNTAIASAINTAVDADASFASTVLSAVVTITHSTAGDVTNLDAGDSGFTIAVTTPGIDSLHQKYFIMYDSSNDSVAFWYDLTGAGIEPAHGATRSVEITGLTTGSTADQVATGTETFIEADEWASSAASSTITATSNAIGERTDLEAGNTGFTVAVTTQGISAGVGAGVRKAKFTVIHTDFNGVTIEGNATDLLSVTVATGAQDIQWTIIGVQATTGFNTGCAKVNGNQSAQTSITVDSGHTMKAGDKAYLLDRTDGTYKTKDVVSITATTVVLDEAVSVTDNDVMSSGLKIGYYRSEANELDLFLVAELPNNSIDGTFTFTDTKLDAQLTAQYQTPATDRSPPGEFKFLSQYKGTLVATGFLDDPDRVQFCDIDSPEYWPALGSGFSFLTDTTQGDRTSGISENNEVLIIGKLTPQKTEGSFQVVSGFLDDFGNYVRDIKSGSLGVTSHQSFVEMVPGIKAFMSTDGAQIVIGGNVPQDIGFRIQSLLEQVFSTTTAIYENRITAINDSRNSQVLFFVPVEPKTGTKYATSDSFVLVYDYKADPNGELSSRWLTWNGLNAAGGFAKNGNDILFSERRLSTFTGTVNHLIWVLNNEDTAQDYYDHVTYFGTQWVSRWEDLGEPNINKLFKWYRLMVTPPFSSAFDVAVTVEFNHAQSTSLSSRTMSFTGDAEGDEDSLMKFAEGKAKAIRITLTTVNVAVPFYYSGYEIEANADYTEGMAS